MRGNRWGVRLTFPVSVSAIRITSTSDLDRLVKGLGLASTEPRLHLSLGGAAMHRKPETSRETYNGHSTFEAAVDAQWPLGFSIGEQAARGGVYAIGGPSTGWSCCARGTRLC